MIIGARRLLGSLIMIMIMVGSGLALVVEPARAETQQASDGATATGPDRLVVGTDLVITGTGWRSPTGVGSVVALKLDEGAVTTTDTVRNPAGGAVITNQTVYGVVQAKADGTFSVTLPFPTTTNASTTWAAGSQHSVRLLTGSLLSGDTIRSVKVGFDVVAQDSATPSASPSGSTPVSPSASPSDAATSAAPSSSASPTSAAPTSAGPSASTATSASCDAATVTLTAAATTSGRPSTTIGGEVRLTGSGFCHPGGGGSKIAIKINDGAYSRLDTSVHTNKTIWQIVDAAGDGTLDVTVRLPTASETDPAFGPGSYTLRLLTGSLQPGDTPRTLQTGEFVVTDGGGGATLPEPGGTPDPVDPVAALVSGTTGGVTLTQSGSRLTLTVPGLEPGDWVFPYVFGRQEVAGFAETAYEPFPTTWLQLDADRQVSVDLADHDVDGASVWRLSVQDRDGVLVGWTALTPYADDADDADDTTSNVSTTSTSSTTTGSSTLASTGGSRPVLVAIGLLLVLTGSLVLRRDLRRSLPR